MKQVNRLTTTRIKPLKSGTHPDGNGLYLVKSDTGSASWILRYWQNKRERRMGLGSYPAVSLAEARKKAVALKNNIRLGITETASMTFRECADALMKQKSAEWTNPKHKQQWENTLQTYAYPVLSNVPVDAITVEQVLRVLKPIWQTKNETATRVRGRVQSVIDYGIALGMRTDSNPASWETLKFILPKPSKVKVVKHHVAMPIDEVPKFYQSLSESASAMCVRWIVLNASRSAEARGANWKEIVGDVWVIPPERMKARKEHRVPLSSQAMDVLDAVNGWGEFLFPSPNKQSGQLSDVSIRKVLHNYNPEYSLHGFRSTFRQWCAERTDVAPEIAELALAHGDPNRIQATYQRSDLLDRRRELMQQWSDFVTR